MSSLRKGATPHCSKIYAMDNLAKIVLKLIQRIIWQKGENCSKIYAKDNLAKIALKFI